LSVVPLLLGLAVAINALQHRSLPSSADIDWARGGMIVFIVAVLVGSAGYVITADSQFWVLPAAGAATMAGILVTLWLRGHRYRVTTGFIWVFHAWRPPDLDRGLRRRCSTRG
jgi:hypothetical protein